MRIDGFQNIPAILQSFKADKSSGSAPVGESSDSSTVSLSSFGEVLQSLQRDSAQSAKLRGQKVDQLAQDAQSGDLEVDITKLASRLISLNVIDTQG